MHELPLASCSLFLRGLEPAIRVLELFRSGSSSSLCLRCTVLQVAQSVLQREPNASQADTEGTSATHERLAETRGS